MNPSPTEPIESSSDLKALEAFVVDNPDLEALESMAGQFNIFEALGAVRQELRHSCFLAYLLDPSQTHGLGDLFVRRLLQKAVAGSEGLAPGVTPVDLDVWRFDHLTIRREWHNIDLLLLVEAHRLAVIVENKIDSGEHSDQLARYRQTVCQQYPEWTVIGIFLTPDGEMPSEESYLPLDYGTVCELLERLVQSRRSMLGPDVRTLIEHYTQVLRRHIVSDSAIAELCRQIYQKHKQAIDLIYEYRPDQQAMIRDYLESLIATDPNLIRLQSSKSAIRFIPKQWDTPVLTAGEGWIPSGHILVFECVNGVDRLSLKLLIGPGPGETRRRLFNLATANDPPLKPAFGVLYPKFNTIYTYRFLQARTYAEGTAEAFQTELSKRWNAFHDHELPKILEITDKEDWLNPEEATP